eukprot:c8831_g1_i1 orf=88-555(+)
MARREAAPPPLWDANSPPPSRPAAGQTAPPSPLTNMPRPKPSDLIAFYTSTGMDRDAASEKVIEDLQNALRASFQRYSGQRRMDKSFRTAIARLEAATGRLSALERKLDSKPGFVEVFGAGVAAGAFLQTVVKAAPYVAGTVAEIYGNVRKFSTR